MKVTATLCILVVLFISLQSSFLSARHFRGKQGPFSPRGPGSGKYHNKPPGSASSDTSRTKTKQCSNDDDCKGELKCYTDKCVKVGWKKLCKPQQTECKNCTSDGTAETCKAGQLYCPDRITCATKCDNVTDCPGWEDELGCPVCPNCTGNETGCRDRYGFQTDCLQSAFNFLSFDGFTSGINPYSRLLQLSQAQCQRSCIGDNQCVFFVHSATANVCWIYDVKFKDAFSSGFSKTGDFKTYVRECVVC